MRKRILQPLLTVSKVIEYTSGKSFLHPDFGRLPVGSHLCWGRKGLGISDQDNRINLVTELPPWDLRTVCLPEKTVSILSLSLQGPLKFTMLCPSFLPFLFPSLFFHPSLPSFPYFLKKVYFFHGILPEREHSICLYQPTSHAIHYEAGARQAAL